MKTDTAHTHWNTEWKDAPPKWRAPEADVTAWAEGLEPGAHILDLGAGVGRHALALAQRGFEVTAIDASPVGLAEIEGTARAEGLKIATHQALMTELPLKDGSVDHVLSWNVIYHGDEAIVRRAIAEIARVLKPGGTFMGTMLSARRLPVERAKARGREVSRSTWVFDGDGDKVHPHYFCTGRVLLELFADFEVMRLADREHDSPGSWHWHITLERQ